MTALRVLLSVAFASLGFRAAALSLKTGDYLAAVLCCLLAVLGACYLSTSSIRRGR